MRICIPIPPRPEGGMYTFLANWRCWLDKQGITHTEDLETEFDILFVNSWAVSYKLIHKVKRRYAHVRVIQRVDGSARDYGRFDDADERQARVNMLADLTIMQSKYSRYTTTQKFKIIQHSGPVIYNPVDIETFHPADPLPHPNNQLRVCNVSFSLGHKKGTWQIGELAQKNPDVTFILCGHYPELPNLPNIQLLGHLDRPELATAIRSCHVFIHLAENDPCPNVVLEGLASGLPVLYKDSGGSPELVGDCGLPITIGSFRQQLEIVLQQHERLSKAARNRAVEHFSPDRIFPQYLEAIVQAKRRPMPTFRDFIHASRQGYPVIPYRPRQLYWFTKRWIRANIIHRSSSA